MTDENNALKETNGANVEKNVSTEEKYHKEYGTSHHYLRWRLSYEMHQYG